MSEKISRTPEYSEPTNIYQAVIGSGMDIRYVNIPLVHCLDCGSVVMDKESHGLFHDRLYKSACRS